MNDPFVTQFEVFEMFVLCLWEVWEVCFVSLTCLRSLVSVFEMFEKFVLCFWCVFFWDVCAKRKLASKDQSLQKLDPQKTLANEKTWQRWIRRIPCLIKRSARPNKCMTNNMARQREQSQDKPAWKPLNTTWPQNPEASYWNITTLWAQRNARTKAGKTDPQNVSQTAASDTLNLTHSQKRFKHAQRKPKQKYEGQHGTEKGAVLRRTSLKTTKAKRRPQSLKWYIEPSRWHGFKETRRQRRHGLSEVAINAKPDSRSGTAWVAGAKTKDPTITLVNCTGDRRRDQESDNQSASLHRWQAHTHTHQHF